jgi:hypothetical protein
MNVLIRRQKAVAIIVLGVFALALGELSRAESAKKTKIHEIETAKLSVAGAAKIKVSATGTVTSSGWTQPQLIASSTPAQKTGNSDEVTLHFDFVATKPTGIVPQVITPIAAETTCPDPGVGKTLKVVVHSATNEKSDSIKSAGEKP